MSDNPYESRDIVGESATRKRGSPTRTLLKWFGVLGVIAIAVALFLPSIRTAREPARRMQCANNLKQIGLALCNYEHEYHALPPAYTVDAEGKPLHSWRTLILPYLEQKALYDTIDLSKPWNDPANKRAYDITVPAYRCPSTNCPPGHTTYLAVVAPGSCLRPAEPRKLSEITDKHSLTLIVLEVDPEHSVHWMSPNGFGRRVDHESGHSQVTASRRRSSVVCGRQHLRVECQNESGHASCADFDRRKR